MLDDLAVKGHQVMTCRATTLWRNDPKCLLFVLSRHKTVSKFLDGYGTVLEVGCGDGFANRLLHNHVNSLTSIDIDPVFIKEAEEYSDNSWPVSYFVHNILDSPFFGVDNSLFDAAFSLDVFEHIQPTDSHKYASNVAKSLKDNGVFIVGCPSLESQPYASEGSKLGHVNCMNGNDLKSFFHSYFDHCFLLSMNDEVLHTGFTPMAHYNLLVCVNPKQEIL